MGASPIGAIRMGVEVFRPETRIREKDRKISEPSGASARGFFIFWSTRQVVEARALGVRSDSAAGQRHWFLNTRSVVCNEDAVIAKSHCAAPAACQTLTPSARLPEPAGSTRK